MDPLIGKTLGKYKIEALLGEGGMGAVYQARHIQLGHAVAIKVMHPHFARLPEFRARFLQEAQTAARLEHAGIVKVQDFVETSELLYIVMEFIRGNNLQQLLESQRSQGQWIPLNEAVQLIRQVGLALDYAHRHGVLHRDIKPANIMLKLDPESPERFQPIITDLGLAKLSQGGLVTQPNSTMGTPAYMSPEQLQGEHIDARSDVYSLGVLLYELAVGRRPFPIRSMTEAIRYHTREQPRPPRSLRADLPLALERIILRAMAKMPAERFPSAAALVQALTTIGAGDLPATVPATAREALSLYTQVQESMVAERGSSLIQEFPPAPPARSTVDQLQILAPDGKARSLPMQGRRLIVGRDESCDLPLKNDEKVSRHHARIEFDGQTYSVIDLESTNGTRLGNKKLQPGAAETWLPGQPLRIGKHTLRLIKATAQAAPINSAANATQMDKEVKAPIFTQLKTDIPVTPRKQPTPAKSTGGGQGNRTTRQAGRWVIWLVVGLLVAGVGGLGWRLNWLPANLLGGGDFGLPSPTVTLTPELTEVAPNVTPATDISTPDTPASDTPLPPTNTPLPPTNTAAPSEAPPTATPVPPTTTSVPPTSTPVPTSTAVPTSTPLPTSTPRPPTATPRPTNTPLPPTATPRPTPTPLPPPTPTPEVRSSGNSGSSNSGQTASGHFRVEVQKICTGERGFTWFEGTVYVNNQPANGYLVAWASRKGSATFKLPSGPQGERPDWPAGYYAHLGPTDKFVARAWRAWIMNANGDPISDYGDWDSDGPDGPCNKAIINFYSP